MDFHTALLPAERRQFILSEIAAQGVVRVDELGRRFDVSEMTVRRDLDILDEEGLLERTHGGAIALQRITAERFFHEKDGVNREVKAAIGRRAAELAADGETVLVNSGSTTRQVILHLAARRNLRIVTNNIAAVAALPEDTAAEVILLGGRMRTSSGCVVGDWAVRLLDDLAPDRAFIGADGISLRDGVSSPVPEEADLTRLMISRTRGRVTVVADSGKIGRVCAFRIAPLSSVNDLVTGGEAARRWTEDFAAVGVDVIAAD